MGKIVERKKKKKGRPSLLDLQKRSLKEQQHQHLLLLRDKQRQEDTKLLNNHDNPNSTLSFPINYKSETSTPPRRSSRRNLNQNDGDDDDMGLSGEAEEDGEEPNGDEQDEDEDVDEDDDEEGNGGRREKKFKLVLKLPQNENSEHNFGMNASNSVADDDAKASIRRKRNIEETGDGSGFKTGLTSVANGVEEQEPTTPLPDKKLLSFILDRLQKKDTYGVFSEQVDPEELPDYHEVIEHPMDFGTIRKKLSDGLYTILEEFERDVFLICSNAMHYNARDTVYFRQARSIQELAKKDFENLRQDSDDCEPEPKVVRRGRPPTRNLKKAIQRLSLDRARSENCSDATLATSTDKTMVPNGDPRKFILSAADSTGKFRGSPYEYKYERNDEASAPFFKGMKQVKRPGPLDENKRNTYNQFFASSSTRDSSVLTTFHLERKQLMAVGLTSEHGYARSLARFAASIGPVAWKVASLKIESSLPPEVEFGPGWVGDNDLPPSKPLLPSSSFSAEMAMLWPSSLPGDQPIVSQSNQSRNQRAIEVERAPKNQLTRSVLDTVAAALPGATHISEREAIDGLGADCNTPWSSFPNHQTSVWRQGMNGLNGTYEGSGRPDSGKARGNRSYSFTFHPAEPVDSFSRMNSAPHPKHGGETPETLSSVLHPPPSWQPQPVLDRQLTQFRKVDSVPPDLNVRFQGQGSPSSTRPDPTQPDLALQL